MNNSCTLSAIPPPTITHNFNKIKKSKILSKSISGKANESKGENLILLYFGRQNNVSYSFIHKLRVKWIFSILHVTVTALNHMGTY